MRFESVSATRFPPPNVLTWLNPVLPTLQGAIQGPEQYIEDDHKRGSVQLRVREEMFVLEKSTCVEMRRRMGVPRGSFELAV